MQAEYDEIKLIKQQLKAFRNEISGEVPLGVRKYEPDQDINEMLSTDSMDFQQNDPDKWPSPVPAVHSSRLQIYIFKMQSSIGHLVFF